MRVARSYWDRPRIRRNARTRLPSCLTIPDPPSSGAASAGSGSGPDAGFLHIQRTVATPAHSVPSSKLNQVAMRTMENLASLRHKQGDRRSRGCDLRALRHERPPFSAKQRRSIRKPTSLRVDRPEHPAELFTQKKGPFRHRKTGLENYFLPPSFASEIEANGRT